MSHSTLRQTLQRIEDATKDSRIAVFRSEFRGKLNATFHDTAYSHALIANKDKSYIGSFYNNGDMDGIKTYLDGFVAR